MCVLGESLVGINNVMMGLVRGGLPGLLLILDFLFFFSFALTLQI